jgi:hypothetical protein
MRIADIPEDMGKWQKSVMDKLRQYHHANARGLRAMMNADLLDIFDALAVSPLFASEAVASPVMPEFERRRCEDF